MLPLFFCRFLTACGSATAVSGRLQPLLDRVLFKEQLYDVPDRVGRVHDAQPHALDRP